VTEQYKNVSIVLETIRPPDNQSFSYQVAIRKH